MTKLARYYGANKAILLSSFNVSFMNTLRFEIVIRLGFTIALALFFALSQSSADGQSFATNSRLLLGVDSNKTASVRVGDLDGDGDQDVVVANGRHWPQRNFAHLNQGRGRFTVTRPIGSDRLTTYACELADLDGDGDLDIATGNDNAPCKIFLNDGKGQFVLKGTFGKISSVRSMTIVDIDQDKDNDILLTCRGRSNWIYLNDGNAGFENGIEFGTATDSTIDVAVGDVNGDGHNDLVLANRDGQPNAWLLNDGKLNFSDLVAFGDPKSQSRAVVLGDFNGDKKLDWAVGNIGQPNKLFLGDGSGGVASEIVFGRKDERTYCLASADIDQDGDLDLVAGNVGQQNAVFINSDNGGSLKAVLFGGKDNATYGLDLGDFNGDGKIDIAVANSDAENRVFLNRAGGQGTQASRKQASVKRNSVQKKEVAAKISTSNDLAEFQKRPEYRTTDWPEFRGLGGRGVAEGFSLPTTWNADSESGDLENVQWQADVPGLGHSSPVIKGKQLFLLTAVASDGEAPLQVQSGGKPTAADDNGVQDWLLISYDKTNGNELWRQTLYRGKPRATRHAKATHANTSVCITGDRIITFLGSEGLYCHSLDGEIVWKQDLGVIDISKYGIGWGFSSSPSVHDDRIVLVCDDPDNAFVAARRLSDGTEIWRTSRKDICERSWGTPRIHKTGDRTQVVVNGWPKIMSYDLDNGKEIWRLDGGGDNPVPTPFEAHGMLFITNAHGGPSPIFAIAPTASGDLSTDSGQGINWKIHKGGSYMSTPVVYGNQIYVGSTRGIVGSFDASTGERKFQGRLGSKAGVIASLVAGDGKIYCASENGTVYVLEHGPEKKLIAENKMAEPCLATPAISKGTIFIRTTKRLIAVGDPNQ